MLSRYWKRQATGALFRELRQRLNIKIRKRLDAGKIHNYTMFNEWLDYLNIADLLILERYLDEFGANYFCERIDGILEDIKNGS